MEKAMVYTYNGVPVTTMSRFAEAYGVLGETLRQRFNRHKNAFILNEDVIFLDGEEFFRFKEMNNIIARRPEMWIFTEKGITKLLSISNNCRTDQIFSIADEMNLPVMQVKTNKEYETLRIIQSSFGDLLTLEKQKRVLSYRIDLYIPELKIAVECDENGHSHYVNDEVRQKAIEKELGCTFIRYNPDDKDFNIGVVINQIMRKYLECQNKTLSKVNL